MTPDERARARTRAADAIATVWDCRGGSYALPDLSCPECGREFTTGASRARHRNAAHDVPFPRLHGKKRARLGTGPLRAAEIEA